MVRAYVDEAQVGGTGSGRPFVLTASVWLSASAEDSRDELTLLRPRGLEKLHWKEMVDRLQDVLISRLSLLHIVHLVAIRRDTTHEKPERSRRAALARLVYELQTGFDVSHVVFESRGPADDRRDLALLGHLRAQRLVSGPLRFDHVPGPQEPLLWVPDAICGIIVDYESGHSRHISAIAHQLTMFDC